jgi:hypothetical protein
MPEHLQNPFLMTTNRRYHLSREMKALQHALTTIVSRELPGGGFGHSEAGTFSPEATAWAIMALTASEKYPDTAKRACEKLAGCQLSDGRVSAVNGFDAAVWPTALCILAWKCAQGYRRPIDAGLEFLLSLRGRHRTKGAHSPIGHPPLHGWPWIEQTHSWIEPTCISMLALKANGHNDHPRTRQAARMVMDHQLSRGGWNYGSPAAFGQVLMPIPENTGQALCALNGLTGQTAVQSSLDYLSRRMGSVRAPLALSWMLHGLGMWSQLPRQWRRAVVESLDLQKRYGPFDTIPLSQLVTVYCSGARLISILV